MVKTQHLLTDLDQLRLRHLLLDLRASGRPRHADVELLSQRVSSACVVQQRLIPRDVVTMNSLVALRDLDDDRIWTCTLTYPEEADTMARKVSVAAPLGALLLGQRVGDTIEFPAESGPRRLRIERIYYQPEAAGDDHL